MTKKNMPGEENTPAAKPDNQTALSSKSHDQNVFVPNPEN
jgi:hypothetical protein